MEQPIYLDNNSTTALDPAVLDVMLPYFTTHFGNPSNPSHLFGSVAADATERARRQVAALVGAEAREIVFTSGATESDNLAILGVGHRHARGHVITSRVEHKAVLAPCRQLEQEGFRVTYLGVDHYGRIDPADVARAIAPDTVLVSVMTANNEVGTLQPIAEIGRICRERHVLFHSDAAQAAGKLGLDVDEVCVDLLSISAHKVYGPKGVGALYVRGLSQKCPLVPLFHGGGQEGGLRPGTLPVPNIVGIGAACSVAEDSLPTESARLRALRDRLAKRLLDAIPGIIVHSHPLESLPGLLSVGFGAVEGDALIYAIPGVALSQGSSCSAGSFEPSHVLRAMGVEDDLARATLRFGVGRFTTPEEIDRAADLTAEAVLRLRQATSCAS